MRAAGAELVSDIPQLDVMGAHRLSAVKAMLQRISRIRTRSSANDGTWSC